MDNTIADAVNCSALLKLYARLKSGLLIWDHAAQHFLCDDYLANRFGFAPQIAFNQLFSHISGQSLDEMQQLIGCALQGQSASALLHFCGEPAEVWFEKGNNPDQAILLLAFKTQAVPKIVEPEQSLIDGLASDALLRQLLIQSVKLAKRNNDQLCVMSIKLNFDNAINEQQQLLQMVAIRLQNSLRSSDNIAYLGESQFIVVLHGTSSDRTSVVGNKLQATLSQAFQLESGSVKPNVGVGVAVYPNDAESPDELLQLSLSVIK